MSPRTTGLLFALAVALGAFVWLYELRGAPARESARVAESLLFAGLVAPAITELVVSLPDGGSVSARRTETGWRIASPVEFPGVASAFDAMAKSLAALERSGRIEEPADRDVYGLGDGARLVHFVADAERHVMAIGREAPVGANVYVSMHPDRGDAPVDMVHARRLRAFDRTLDQLRDGRVLSFEPADVERISLFWRDGERRDGVTLERVDGSWRFSAPAGLEPDAAAVAHLLDSLRTLQAYSFSDSPLSALTTGIDAPVYRVELGVGTGLLAFAVGGRVEADGDLGEPPERALRYVRSAEESLYLVPDARIAALPHDLFALRFKQVAGFAPAEARALEMGFAGGGSPGESLRVVRDEDAWRIDGALADAARLRALIDVLSNLEAVGIAADALGERERAALGFDPGRVHIRVLGDGDAVLADVQFGLATRSGAILASRAGRSEIYELPSALADQLPRAPEDLHATP